MLHNKVVMLMHLLVFYKDEHTFVVMSIVQVL
jgi:hypothetical protein